MDAVEYVKTRQRMCKNVICSDCKMERTNNAYGIVCMELMENHTKEAVAIVEKWAKKNPVKTYASVFKEKFPKCNMELVIDDYCLREIFGVKNRCDETHSCDHCWNSEYVESEDNDEN